MRIGNRYCHSRVGGSNGSLDVEEKRIDDDKESLEKARKYVKSNKLNESKAIYEKLLQKYPTRPILYREYGSLLSQNTEQMQQALTQYQLANSKAEECCAKARDAAARNDSKELYECLKYLLEFDSENIFYNYCMSMYHLGYDKEDVTTRSKVLEYCQKATSELDKQVEECDKNDKPCDEDISLGDDYVRNWFLSKEEGTGSEQEQEREQDQGKDGNSSLSFLEKTANLIRESGAQVYAQLLFPSKKKTEDGKQHQQQQQQDGDEAKQASDALHEKEDFADEWKQQLQRTFQKPLGLFEVYTLMSWLLLERASVRDILKPLKLAKRFQIEFLEKAPSFLLSMDAPSNAPDS
ncbi:hypothetical protein RFI_15688, partial [Reticulomyxa filosa]